MTNDSLQQQKTQAEAKIVAREHSIEQHRLAIAAEKALIRADRNTVSVIEGLLEKASKQESVFENGMQDGTKPGRITHTSLQGIKK